LLGGTARSTSSKSEDRGGRLLLNLLLLLLLLLLLNLLNLLGVGRKHLLEERLRRRANCRHPLGCRNVW